MDEHLRLLQRSLDGEAGAAESRAASLAAESNPLLQKSLKRFERLDLLLREAAHDTPDDHLADRIVASLPRSLPRRAPRLALGWVAVVVVAAALPALTWVSGHRPRLDFLGLLTAVLAVAGTMLALATRPRQADDAPSLLQRLCGHRLALGPAFTWTARGAALILAAIAAILGVLS